MTPASNSQPGFDEGTLHGKILSNCPRLSYAQLGRTPGDSESDRPTVRVFDVDSAGDFRYYQEHKLVAKKSRF